MRIRDFHGYGGRPPDPAWPGGARVAVSFVVNVEEGAELSVGDGDERNERVYEVTDEVSAVPDACMETHFEYGTRAGYWVGCGRERARTRGLSGHQGFCSIVSCS